MKAMTCRQLGGACDNLFLAERFDEIANQARQHGLEMVKSGDQEHVKAMDIMKQIMNDPKAMQAWLDTKRQEFNSLPDNK